MATLSPRERGLVGLAVGGLLVAAVYLYAVEPLVATNEPQRWRCLHRPDTGLLWLLKLTYALIDWP